MVLGFWVKGFVFRVWYSGFGIQGFAFRVSYSGFRIQGFVFRGFRVSYSGVHLHDASRVLRERERDLDPRLPPQMSLCVPDGGAKCQGGGVRCQDVFF